MKIGNSRKKLDMHFGTEATISDCHFLLLQEFELALQHLWEGTTRATRPASPKPGKQILFENFVSSDKNFPSIWPFFEFLPRLCPQGPLVGGLKAFSLLLAMLLRIRHGLVLGSFSGRVATVALLDVAPGSWRRSWSLPKPAL
jgi:hypothetical protein